VAAQFTDRFPALRLFSVEETLGEWRDVQRKHFDGGGIFDQIYLSNPMTK
jgi:sulfate transport system substrate-binding protein